jgi:transaldolase / glucose-6-phosphate isomerase
MAVPRLVVSPGKLKRAHQTELEKLQVSDAVRRLWSKDVSLWPDRDSERSARAEQLAWLDLPDRLEHLATHAVRAAAELSEEFDDVVFIAMGSSNLVAELIPSLALGSHGKRFFVLDTIHPEDIRSLENAINLPRTLFLTVSKTGKVLETHHLFLYFLGRLKEAGVTSPGRHFIAVTEEDSYLRDLAAQYQFRYLFLDPAGFPGRFSGLIHFTLLFAALCGWDAAFLQADAKAMREACGPRETLAEHPAANLAALLAAGAVEGHERLAILTHPKLMPLSYRLGQLVGASTCAEGQGIVPLFGITPAVTETIRGKYMAAVIRPAGLPDPDVDRAVSHLERESIPAAFIEVERLENLGAEVYRWEIATCLASALLGVNPFDARDMQEGRTLAIQYLNKMTSRHGLPIHKPCMQQEEIALYAEGATRREISMLSLEEALRTLFSLPEADGYLALLSFLPSGGRIWEMLQAMRERLEAALRVPVLLNQGPRYLHEAGRSYKDGPAHGAFLMLTGRPEGDIAVPGAEYTFGDLGTAMAQADFEALTERHRHVVRLDLGRNSTAAMSQLQKLIERAQVGIRRGSE